MTDGLPALHELAHLAGIETGYWEVDGTHHVASPEALMAILRALGVEIERPDAAGEALHAERLARWSTPLEPCVTSIEGGAISFGVRVAAATTGPLEVTIDLEDGGSHRWSGEVAELPVEDGAPVHGEHRVLRRVTFHAPVPVGYHRLRVLGAGITAEALLLCAPRRAYGAPGELRTFGLFAPVYALRSGDQLGVGDVGDLRRVTELVAGAGGGMVGTLPLLACYYGEPFCPSPYSPVTRLFWNDLFADLRPDAWHRLGLAGAAVLADPSHAEAAALLADTPLVDYRRAWALKRGLLEALSSAVWAHEPSRAQVERFAAERPRAVDYARFRAYGDARRAPWGAWPAAQQAGRITEADVDPASVRTYLLGQLVMHRQLAEIKQSGGAGLYLDLPVGSDGSGYDLWRERSSFASEISVGAPPDPLARGGQNWALPPLHPVRQRAGYRYFIECIRAHMEHAAMLRVDHVMGLHRLFWIPPGGSAADGVYVRYPADELYAILCIESQRQRCAVAGEDLGTVPDQVRPTMADRGVHRLFVAEFGWRWHDGRPTLEAPAPGAVASLDTHDTATFATFAEREGFGHDAGAVMHRWTDEMAAGGADVVLLTVEDLWLEREPQNVPGTSGDEAPNWRRRMARTLDEITTGPEVRGVLDRVATLRKNGPT
ncbi:MAG TPA: 4-alpha-glucanotransferase [Kofleriaceae bacterium]|nr:4-alpha-glucanotransferase [Kofleriaceae bacterium]